MNKFIDFNRFLVTVEKVIWITSKSKTVMVATSHSDWRTFGWKNEIEIVEGIRFSIFHLLKQRHLVIESTNN